MPSATLTLSATIGGIGVSGKITRNGETPLSSQVVLPAAKTGTLTTRTDANTGIVTAQAGHGFITGDTIDVYWGAGLHSSMTATASGNAITLDGGEGTDLPVTTTPVTLSKRVAIEQGFDGALLTLMLVGLSQRGSVRFQDDTVPVLSVNLPGSEAYSWASGLGVVNPLAATTVVQIFCSNQSSSSTNTITIGLLLDTVPAL